MHALTLLAAYVLAVIATARAVRLVVHDAYPPAVAVRTWWLNHTEVHGGWRAEWAPLVTCPFCCAPYIAAVVQAVAMGAGIWSPGWSLAGAWWALAVWASLSYLAAMVVLRDEPPAE